MREELTNERIEAIRQLLAQEYITRDTAVGLARRLLRYVDELRGQAGAVPRS